MDADIILATGLATVHKRTYIAQTNRHAGANPQLVIRVPAHSGQSVKSQALDLPQIRQTHTILGMQPLDGWGLQNGVNDQQLAVSASNWRSRFAGAPGILDRDLVRLALERCAGARQALDFITDLVSRHGQTTSCGEDSIFLIADAHEAYLLEAAGSFWAWTECRSVRAVSNMAIIRQDWQRIAPGAAEHAVQRGWWECDGSKLDFAACMANPQQPGHGAQKRWARATYLLEEQNGHIDGACIRRIVGDPLEYTLHPRRLPGRDVSRGSNTFIAMLCGNGMPIVWAAFGPPHLSLFVPLFLDGELPSSCQHWHPTSVWVRLATMLAAITGDADQEEIWRRMASRLQTRIDQQTSEFLSTFREIRANSATAAARQATLFMQNHVELLENALRKPGTPTRHRDEAEMISA